MNEDSKSIHDFDFTLICEYFANLQRQGPGSPEVTRKALSFIDNLKGEPRLADLGCGTGGQTMVLAENTPGHITGIDLFPAFIDLFNANACQRNFQDRVLGLVGNMDDLPFGTEELDVIWSEGAIYNIGFERGIKEWRRYLKPGGFIAVSEASWLTEARPAEIDRYWKEAYAGIDTIATKVTQIQAAGYIPVATFVLPEICWTEHFYAPQIPVQEQFLAKHAGNQSAAELVENQRHEAEMYARYHAFYGYVFYIGKKI